MTEKLTISQSQILTSLQQEVGGLPPASQQFISEALKHVPDYWHADVASQPFNITWEAAMRERLCQLAHIYLAQVIKDRPMDPLLPGRLYRDLDTLAHRGVTKVSDDLQGHDRV